MNVKASILCIFVFFSSFQLSNAQYSTADSTALLLIRQTTGGGVGGTAIGWLTNPVITASNSWLPTNPVNSWYGTTWVFNGTEFRLKILDLSGLGLTDSLPSGFCTGPRMDSLSFIDLSDNSIQNGPGNPWFITPKNKLREIDLTNNQFIYDPALFTKLGKDAVGLNTIRANNYLDANQAGSPFPDFDSLDFPNLKALELANNGLTGIIPNPRSISVGIEGLDLSDNAFTSIDDGGSTPMFLQELALQNNELDSAWYIELILNDLPQLKNFAARNCLNSQTHNINNLGINLLSTFDGGVIDLGENRLSGEVTLGFELRKLKHLLLDNNQITNIKAPAPLQPALDSLVTLDISHNAINVRMDSMGQLFLKIPNIQFFDLSHNQLYGKLPPLTVIGVPVNFRFEKLKELDMSHNELSGVLHLQQFFALQMQGGATPPAVEAINLSNNKFDDLIIENPTGAVFSNLRDLDVSRNRLEFGDLHRLAKGFSMQRNTTTAFYDFYAPLASPADSLAFNYLDQRPRGVGGARRKPGGKKVVFDALNEEPFAGADPSLWNNFYWYKSPDTTISPTMDSLVGSFERLGPVIFTEPGYVVAPVIFGQPKRNLLVIDSLIEAVHNNQYFYPVVSNDSFPLITISTKPRKVVVGDCYDNFGRAIKCQQVLAQFDQATLAQSNYPDSVKAAVREEFGATIIDSCLCGTIELWEISDTSNQILLEQFGFGTRTTATQADSRTELLSADPNYDLLDESDSGVSSTPSGAPAGSTHPDPTLVAIIDSGTDYEHPDLEDKMFINVADSTQNQSDDDGDCLTDNGWGYNFLNDDNLPFDDHGHGTQVTGIVTGQSMYNLSPSSVNDSIAVLSLKYTDQDGSGSAFHAACAIRHAADFAKYNPGSGDSTRVSVINASWGYYGEPVDYLYNAIEYAANKDKILFVTSSGNDGIDNDTAQHYPSNFNLPNIVVVGATQSVNNGGDPNLLESYSNFGAASVDVAVPGYDISTDIGTTGTLAVQGTSYSAAQISRIAALLMREYPDASYCNLRYALINGSTVLNSADSTKLLSKGVVDYAKAQAILDTMAVITNCRNHIFTDIRTIGEGQQLDVFEDLSIYPNPFSEYLMIQFNGNANNTKNQLLNLNIADISGRILLEQQINLNSRQSLNLNMDHLPAGVYFVRFAIGNKQKVEKIIKFK